MPDPVANVVRKESFDHYKMTAFLISYQEFNDGDSLPLSIAIGAKEKLMLKAKLSRLTSCFYHVEFDLPCEKFENASEYHIFIKCGDGEEVKYKLFKDRGEYLFYLFMSGKAFPHLTSGYSSEGSGSTLAKPAPPAPILEETSRFVVDALHFYGIVVWKTPIWLITCI